MTDNCENITFPRTTYVVGKHNLRLLQGVFLREERLLQGASRGQLR